MAEISDIIGQIRRPEKTVPICLAGDLQAEFEELERDLALAREAGRPSEGTLAGGANPMATTIAQQIMELRERMREHTVVFRFRGLSSKAYSDLVAQHPPTEEEKEKGLDIGWDTFPAALIAACAISPAMTAEQARRLSDELTQAQWDALFSGAFSVNKRDVDVPFSYGASAVLRSSAKNSK